MGLIASLKADWAKSKAAWKDGQAKLAIARTEKAQNRIKAGDRHNLNIVGESFDNPDGASRQLEIKRCREGESVTLRAEPENKFSDQAIAVFSCRNVQIGYIGSEHCEWVARLMRNPDFEAEIGWISGSKRGKPSRGIVLSIAPC
jgi:HIRAN domain